MAQNNRKVNYEVKLSASVDSSLKKLAKKVEELEKQIESINSEGINPKVSSQSQKGVDKLGKSVGKTKGLTQGLTAQFPMLGEAIAALSNPITAVGAAIAATGVILVNTAQEIRNLDAEVKKFSKNAAETEKVSDSFRSLQKTLGDAFDPKEAIKFGNKISKEFNIPLSQATKLIEDIEIATRGAFDSTEIASDVIAKLADAGVTAQEAFSIAGGAVTEGLDVDKTLETIGEFGLKIREMGKAQEDALKEAGFDPKQITKDLESGAKKQREVFNEIFSKEGMTMKQKQTLIADIAGTPAEDIGERGLKFLIKQNQLVGDLAKKQVDLLKIKEENDKLSKAEGRATRQLIPVIKKVESIWRSIQTQFFEIITPIVDLGMEIGKLLEELGIFDAAAFEIGAKFEILKQTVFAVFKTVQFIVRGIRALVRLVKDQVMKTFNSLKETIIDIFGEERIKKWKVTILAAFTFIKDTWDSIAKSISDTFEKLGNFSKLGKFKTDIELSAKEEDGEGGEGGFIGPPPPPPPGKGDGKTGGGTAPTVDQKVATALDNNVRSSVQGEVKNVTVSIDKVQEIGVQNIGANDMESFKENLQEALTGVIADTSQL